MSKAANSPTARLLRSSRLFSLPRPLPAAHLDRPSAQGLYRGSDTATLPYPTHQAITTPASSNFRGDWGLKRPLPAKSTRRTSTPIIRVHQQDTYEHITDFASAADHALNARKWAEMGVPMVHRSPKRGDQKMSVYEDHLDTSSTERPLSKPTGKARDAPKSSRERRTATSQQFGAEESVNEKWRFAGPWIAGMHEDEFRPWLKKTLDELQNSNAWLDFVSTWYGEKRIREARRRAKHAGDAMDAVQLAQLRKLLRPTTEQCKEILKTLRHDHEKGQLRSELTELICVFLELPNVYASSDEMDRSQDAFTVHLADSLGVKDQGRGPLSTHPGAGLSYTRTTAFMENHPEYGPQTRRSPVLARVLRTRSSTAGGKERYAKLGVGGFVTSDQFTSTFQPNRINRNLEPPTSAQDLTEELDPDLEGGNKIWVHPESAHVDESGSIHLTIRRSEDEAVAVKTGDVQNIFDNRAGGAFVQNRASYQAISSGSDRYGSGSIGGFATVPRPPGVTGFDEDSGFQSTGETAVSRVQNMLKHGRR